MQVILLNWQSLCLLADKKKVYSKVSKSYTTSLWQAVELSLPLVLQSDVNHIWRIRVMRQTVEKKTYLDIRKFKIIRTEVREEYQITDQGILFSVEEWIQILNPLIKLINKFRG